MGNELRHQIEKIIDESIDEKIANYILILYKQIIKDLDVSNLPPDGL